MAASFSVSMTSEELTEWLKERLSEKQIFLTDEQSKRLRGITGKQFAKLTESLLQDFGNISIALEIMELVNSLFFEVRATYHNAKKIRGIRAAMYRHAHQHGAYYPSDRTRSIYYEDGSDDLQIALVFKKEEAKNFHTFLCLLYLENPAVKLGDISVRESLEVVYVANEERVLLEHYKAEDSESPIQSLEEFSAVSCSVSVASLNEPVAQFQCFVKLERSVKPYRCHIKPKAFKKLANNESNILCSSWLFHQYFDGLNTVDHTGAEGLPLVAIRLDPNENLRDVVVGDPPQRRTRVSLLLECRPGIGQVVGPMLKNGSERVGDSDETWKTFVHVADAKVFCECLEWKYQDTQREWKEVDSKLRF